MSNDNLLNRLGMTLAYGEVEVGKTYPLYGMVTKIIDEKMDDFTIQVNHKIVLKCSIQDENFVNQIKERAFEPGIFIATITQTEPVSGDCSTIVFGRKKLEEVV